MLKSEKRKKVFVFLRMAKIRKKNTQKFVRERAGEKSKVKAHSKQMNFFVMNYKTEEKQSKFEVFLEKTKTKK